MVELLVRHGQYNRIVVCTSMIRGKEVRMCVCVYYTCLHRVCVLYDTCLHVSTPNTVGRGLYVRWAVMVVVEVRVRVVE